MQVTSSTSQVNWGGTCVELVEVALRSEVFEGGVLFRTYTGPTHPRRENIRVICAVWCFVGCFFFRCHGNFFFVPEKHGKQKLHHISIILLHSHIIAMFFIFEMCFIRKNQKLHREILHLNILGWNKQKCKTMSRRHAQPQGSLPSQTHGLRSLIGNAPAKIWSWQIGYLPMAPENGWLEY